MFAKARLGLTAFVFAMGAAATLVSMPANAGGDHYRHGRDAFSDAKNEHWGVVSRNTIGSPVGFLRDGPFVPGPGGEPPFGDGSLGLAVAAVPGSVEKIDFGNEVDFFGDPLAPLTNVGFWVFQTGESGPANTPNIRIEIAPNGTGYTTMVWNPEPITTANRWSDFIDATTNGSWWFTNGAGGCTLATPCSFVVAKSKVPTATIYSIAVGKGRDSAWVGAIDGLRLNNTIYDFEAGGVRKRSARW